MKQKHYSLAFLMCNIIFLSSCASALKKKCESTNWFHHGEKIALEGRRVTGDEFVLSCEKEEAKIDHSALDVGFKTGMRAYCSPEGALQTGKVGDPINVVMCEGENIAKLRQQHAKGIDAYCAKENGQPAGASGKKYRNVCPKDQEKDFLPGYKVGRKQYLTAIVQERERDLTETTNQIQLAQVDKRNKEYDAQRIANERVPVTRERLNGDGSKSYYTEMVEPLDAQSRRNSVNHEISTLSWKISDLEKEKARLREDIRNANTEIAGLN